MWAWPQQLEVYKAEAGVLRLLNRSNSITQHHDLLATLAFDFVSVGVVRVEKEVGGMEMAHEGMIWSLAWHPLGHILCSGSNDHTRYSHTSPCSSSFWLPLLLLHVGVQLLMVVLVQNQQAVLAPQQNQDRLLGKHGG